MIRIPSFFTKSSKNRNKNDSVTDEVNVYHEGQGKDNTPIHKNVRTSSVGTTNSSTEVNYTRNTNYHYPKYPNVETGLEQTYNSASPSSSFGNKSGRSAFQTNQLHRKDHEAMSWLTNINDLEAEKKRLEADKETLNASYKELKSKFDILTAENGQLNRDISGLQDAIKKSKAINDEKDAKIRNLENRQQNRDTQGIIKSLQEKDAEILSLRKQNAELREEASHYQSALGEATNFQMSDDDQNNTVQLKNDIEKLQDMIEDYVTNLKIGVDINSEEVNKLLQHYECETSSRRTDRLLIKAVLQRHVIDIIYFHAKNLFSQDEILESEIPKKGKELSELLERFSMERLGNDEVTRASSIKLRQLIHAALGNRGFSKVEIKKGNRSEFVEHQFITSVSNKLDQSMDQYRIIKDVEKKKSIEELSPEIVRDTIRLFFYRFEVQEPITRYFWFDRNSKIQKNYMKGQWDDEEVKTLTVGICYFPLIGKNFDDPQNFRIYTPAKVYPQEVKRM